MDFAITLKYTNLPNPSAAAQANTATEVDNLFRSRYITYIYLYIIVGEVLKCHKIVWKTGIYGSVSKDIRPKWFSEFIL